MTASVPVEPGSARWDELISECVKRDADRNWYIGDAALEIAPMGPTRSGPHGVIGNLRPFAEQLGVSYLTLKNYRQTAHMWKPDSRRSDCTWSVHFVLMSHADLMQPGMTLREAVSATRTARGDSHDDARRSPRVRDVSACDDSGQHNPSWDDTAASISQDIRNAVSAVSQCSAAIVDSGICTAPDAGDGRDVLLAALHSALHDVVPQLTGLVRSLSGDLRWSYDEFQR